jgi:exosortase
MNSEERQGSGSSDLSADKHVNSVWRRVPDKSVLLVIFAAWFGLFHFLGNSTLGYVKTQSIFGWWFWVNTRGLEGAGLGEALERILSADEAHVWFVPFVALALLWWKRRELMELPKRTWWPAFGLFAFALLLHILGYMVQQTRISIVAFFLGIYAMTGLVWGWPWLRATLFPFFILLFCIPLGNSTEYVTFPLRLIATKITAVLANGVLGIDVIQNGTSIWEPSGRYQYEVAAACSGIRSLTAIFVLAAVYGFMEFPKNWQRLLLAAMAFPLAVVGNSMRLLSIIVAAETFGQAAGNYVHESVFFSLVPYVPVIAGLGLAGHWLRKLRLETPAVLQEKAA